MTPVLKAVLLLLAFLVAPLLSLLGDFGREFYLALVPFARLGGFIYLGFLLRQTNTDARWSLVPVVLLIFAAFFGILFVSGSIGDWYVLPMKVMAGVEHGPFTHRYAEAHAAVDGYLQKEVGKGGVVGHLLISARRSMTKEGFGRAVASQFEGIDSLGGLIAALVNIVLIAIPWLIVWLIGVVSESSANPAHVYLGWWSFFSFALFSFGYWISKYD
jgi:hypothetical protein